MEVMHCQFTFLCFLSPHYITPGNGQKEGSRKKQFFSWRIFSVPLFSDSHRFKTDVLTGGGQLGLYLPWWGNTNTMERKRGCVLLDI